MAVRREAKTPAFIGSIRPYLVAARKWYSEADAGPSAEAGAEAGDSNERLVNASSSGDALPQVLSF